MQIAAAYAVDGPYHGAYAMLPVWKTHVEPQEASHTYLLVAGTTNRNYVPFPGEDPPDLNNAIWVGVSVSVIYNSLVHYIYIARLDHIHSQTARHHPNCFDLALHRLLHRTYVLASYINPAQTVYAMRAS